MSELMTHVSGSRVWCRGGGKDCTLHPTYLYIDLSLSSFSLCTWLNATSCLSTQSRFVSPTSFHSCFSTAAVNESWISCHACLLCNMHAFNSWGMALQALSTIQKHNNKVCSMVLQRFARSPHSNTVLGCWACSSGCLCFLSTDQKLAVRLIATVNRP